jgi:hypothetical protein
MPVTEAATLPLVAGSNVLERGSQAARIWQDMIATISQQEGSSISILDCNMKALTRRRCS